MSSFVAFPVTAPRYMNRPLPPLAALALTDLSATLPRLMQEGLMHFRNCVRAPAVGALLALLAASPVAAQATFSSEGTYEIPPGAKFNPDKLAKITAFFKNEVDTGKISGADVLIRQRGKDVYHETFGVQDVVSKAPITDK